MEKQENECVWFPAWCLPPPPPSVEFETTSENGSPYSYSSLEPRHAADETAARSCVSGCFRCSSPPPRCPRGAAARPPARPTCAPLVSPAGFTSSVGVISRGIRPSWRSTSRERHDSRSGDGTAARRGPLFHRSRERRRRSDPFWIRRRDRCEWCASPECAEGESQTVYSV